MDKHIIAVIVTVLLLFGVIVSLTGVLGNIFGKGAELISLGVIALALLVLLLIDRNKKE